MISAFGNWIRNIALFVIFSALIEMIMPESHFRKYIHMMMGLIMMLILIRPITSLFFENDYTFESYIEINQLEMERQGMAKQRNDLASKQDELVLDAYKSNLREQIKGLIERNMDIRIAQIEVFVNEDYNGNEFGMLQKIEMTVEKKEEPLSGGVTVNPIKPIRINSDYNKNQKEKEGIEDSEVEKNIKSLLINFYNLSSDNIHISVRKK